MPQKYFRVLPLFVVSLLVTAILLPRLVWGQATKNDESRPPNFIVLFADDLGYGDLSCYGSDTIATPEIDLMAAEGMRLTSFYASAPFCSPSRASILTGRYPLRAGVPAVLFPHENTGLPPSEITIAEQLKQAGYATLCIGKWHLGTPLPLRPHRQGFDAFYGLPHSNDSEWPPGEPFRAQFSRAPLPLMSNDAILEAPVYQETLTERYTERAIEFILRNRNRPFFLYLPHTFPHTPLYASERFRGKSQGGLYGDAVETLDWSTGRILDTLRKTGLDENTLVVFTSDNGPSPGGKNSRFGERGGGGSAGPLRGHKGQTFEGGMRVPGIFWWPGRIPAGGESGAVTSILDLFPTVCALAGQAPPENVTIDGKDLMPLLSGETGDGPNDLFCYYFGNQLQAVRSGPWKLFLQIDEFPKKRTQSLWYDLDESGKLFERHHRLWPKPELYNLEKDIGETKDVAKDHPDIVARLTQEAAAFDAALQKDKTPQTYVDGPAPPKAGEIRVEKAELKVPDAVRASYRLPYAETPDGPQFLDLYVPRAKAPHPAVVLIHGGGWVKGAREDFTTVAIRLASEGYMAATIDYRLAAEGKKTYPEALHDCKSAVRWLRAHAAEYGVDPDRVAAVGSSAGGQLAAMLGVTGNKEVFEGEGGHPDESSEVQAVCVMAGPVDLTSEEMIAYSRQSPTWFANLYLGKTFDEDRQLHRQASPIHHVDETAPPFLFIDGSEDTPGERYTEFREMLDSLKVRNELKVIEGGKHGMWKFHPWFEPTMETLIPFLDSALKAP